MTYIIYGVIILVVLFKGRSYLMGWVMKYKNNKNKSLPNKDFVYTPILATRTFNVAIEIEEIGGGQAYFSVVKQPKI